MPISTLPAVGERLRCEQCGMTIEVTTACECEQGAPQFMCCGKPLNSLGHAPHAETKEAFLETMQSGLDKTEDTVTWLNERAGQSTDATKAELSRESEVLSNQFEKLRGSLDEVKDSTGDAWKDLAKACSESWQRLKAACERAVQRYQ